PVARRSRRGDLSSFGDRRGDELDRLLHRDAVALGAVAEAEGDRSGFGVLTAGDEDEGYLLLRRVADLLVEAVVAAVQLGAHAAGPEAGDDVGEVVVEDVGDRDGDDLDGGKPGRE